MSDIPLDASGEIILTNNDIILTVDLNATRQRLSQKLKFFFREWFLEQTRGIPYFEQVFVKNPNPTVIDALFKREIIEDPAVIELRFFDQNFDETARTLTTAFKALTVNGLIDFSEEITI